MANIIIYFITVDLIQGGNKMWITLLNNVIFSEISVYSSLTLTPELDV